jgi:hypothetical protein
MQLVAMLLLWRGGVVCILLMLTAVGIAAWCFWKCSIPRTLRATYSAVANHLEQGYSLARPQDKPGSDPGTKQLAFWRLSNDTVIIARIDWDSSLEKWYVLTVNGRDVRLERYLAGPRDAQSTAADELWVRTNLTRKRCRYLRKAVARHYSLACVRQRDDNPRQADFVLAR